MDNDNPLLEKARNLYKGWRFGWKYRGVRCWKPRRATTWPGRPSQRGGPFLFARCGATEMRTVADWQQNKGHFADRTRQEIRALSGVFPTDDDTLGRFCERYVACAQSADLLALWDVGAEREVIRGCRGTTFAKLRALEPYYHQNPWSSALAGKKVLVVHPFKDTILRQYSRREALFPAPKFCRNCRPYGYPGRAGPGRAGKRLRQLVRRPGRHGAADGCRRL